MKMPIRILLLVAILGPCWPAQSHSDQECGHSARRLLSLVPSSGPPKKTFPSYPDLQWKKEIVSNMPLPPKAKQIIPYLGYLRPGPKINALRHSILKELGVNKEQMAFLNRRRIFEVDPLEYQFLATIPPINPAYIRPGAKISIPNDLGNLINARVLALEGDQVEVAASARGKIFKLKYPLDKLFWPIRPGREVIFEDLDGPPSLKLIEKVFDDNHVAFHGKFPVMDAKRVPVGTLALRPRAAVDTRPADLSVPMGTFKATKLRADFQAMENLAKDSIPSLARNSAEEKHIVDQYVQLNGQLIAHLRIEMKRQGISTRVLVAPDKSGLVSLLILGVHPNGNRLLRRLLRQLERQGAGEVGVSITSNLFHNSKAFHYSNRLVLGFESALSLLQHQMNPAIIHSLRHQMYATRRAMGVRSIYDISFEAYGAAYDLYGKTISKDTPPLKLGQFMWAEELSTYLNDAFFYAKKVRHTRPAQQTEALNSLGEVLNDLEAIAHNMANIIGNLLEHAPTPAALIHQARMESGLLKISDTKGRKVNLVLPENYARVTGNAELPTVLLSLSRDDLVELDKIARDELVSGEYVKIVPHLQFLESGHGTLTREALVRYQQQLLFQGQDLWGLRFLHNRAKELQYKRIGQEFGETAEIKLTQVLDLAKTVSRKTADWRSKIAGKNKLASRERIALLRQIRQLRRHLIGSEREELR